MTACLGPRAPPFRLMREIPKTSFMESNGLKSEHTDSSQFFIGDVYLGQMLYSIQYKRTWTQNISDLEKISHPHFLSGDPIVVISFYLQCKLLFFWDTVGLCSFILKFEELLGFSLLLTPLLFSPSFIFLLFSNTAACSWPQRETFPKLNLRNFNLWIQPPNIYYALIWYRPSSKIYWYISTPFSQ